MITLFKLAEHNAVKKNKTRDIKKTHKDIEAFLMVSEFASYAEITFLPIMRYSTFWAGWLTDDKGKEYSYLEVTPNALKKL